MLQVPSSDADVSQTHLQPIGWPGTLHRAIPKTFVPKINIVDNSLQEDAQSSILEKNPVMVSEPSHSVFFATNSHSKININIIAKEKFLRLRRYALKQ